jgi:FixJ family two-component response regulator
LSRFQPANAVRVGFTSEGAAPEYQPFAPRRLQKMDGPLIAGTLTMNLDCSSERKPIVLVIDDDTAVRRLLGRVVESVGGQPVLAASGTEGYGYLAELHESVALLLLDVSMADMNGFAFREIQLDATQVARIPTVIITGHALSADEIAQLKPAADLTKPVAMTALQDTIARYTRPGHVRPDRDREVATA